MNSARVQRLRAMLAGRVVACACALLPLAAGAEYPFEDLIGDPNKDWVEVNPDLPAPPDDAQLQEFYVSPVAHFHFLVDRASISIDSDGVVRFTLVAKSDSGVRNARFEGIRCITYETKIYAVASPDGKWERSRNPSWSRIAEAVNNRENAALAKDVVCVNGVVPSVAEFVRRLKATSHDRVPV